MSDQLSKHLKIDDSCSDWNARFLQIAQFLLNGVDLVVDNNKRFKFAELEFYYTSPNHPDPFTHQSEHQLENACWYFHRTGKTYKSGTYKGLDIAIGDKAKHIFGGVLIRALEDESGEVVEGSCLCVDAILGCVGVKSVPELADDLLAGDLHICSAKSPLRIEILAKPRTSTINRSMRVGLTLKQKEQYEKRLEYIGAEYRFITRGDVIRKGAPQLAAALAFQGCDVAEVCSRLGLKPKTAQQYVDDYKSGLSKDIKAFNGAAIKPAEYADLFGRWVKHTGKTTSK